MVPVQTNDRVSDPDATTDDPAKRDPAEIITVIKIRHEHLEKRLGRSLRRRHRLDDGFKQRRHVVVGVRQIPFGETLFRARVDDREIELFVSGL